MPELHTTYAPPHPLDPVTTLGVLSRGPHDPTIIVQPGSAWIALPTPAGDATLNLTWSGGEIAATAWGLGAGEALHLVPALLGADDDATGFDAAAHPLIATAAARNPGLRLTRTGRVFDALAGAVLEQKVTAVAAHRSWRYLCTNHGTAAPGPTPRPMFVAPDAESWRTIPSWEWHHAGVEPSQSRTIVRSAGRAWALESRLPALETGPERDNLLTALPGVGPWTAAETRIRALGDSDAVSLFDYHLPHVVGYALAGMRTDDAGMLDLLEPWSGHRQRVIRLIYASGVREPRRGPRLAPEDHRRR